MARKIISQLERLIAEQENNKISYAIKELYLSHKIDAVKDMTPEEILLLSKSFDKGRITDLNQDVITAITNSTFYPLSEILKLDNFGDSLLALKIDLVNENIFHKLSFHNDTYINKDNFQQILLESDSLKLSKIDIDYIFAMAFTLNRKINNKRISFIMKKCIENVKYDYLYYFSTEGIIAAEKLGLDIGNNESSLSYKVNVKDIYAG